MATHWSGSGRVVCVVPGVTLVCAVPAINRGRVIIMTQTKPMSLRAVLCHPCTVSTTCWCWRHAFRACLAGDMTLWAPLQLQTRHKRCAYPAWRHVSVHPHADAPPQRPTHGQTPPHTRNGWHQPPCQGGRHMLHAMQWDFSGWKCGCVQPERIFSLRKHPQTAVKRCQWAAQRCLASLRTP